MYSLQLLYPYKNCTNYPFLEDNFHEREFPCNDRVSPLLSQTWLVDYLYFVLSPTHKNFGRFQYTYILSRIEFSWSAQPTQKYKNEIFTISRHLSRNFSLSNILPKSYLKKLDTIIKNSKNNAIFKTQFHLILGQCFFSTTPITPEMIWKLLIFTCFQG